ncbi:MAG: glycosyltransferase family 4 protein [Verrucomicrobia bacterium]|nr:glycosyltransferase family 4 protein [Verrucomicrobiota bacterium]
MKIAQVAPLYESVPPKLYGGSERVVSYLTESLVELGHDVTLFASGDSITRARLVPGCEGALRLQGRKVVDPISHHVRLIETVFQRSAEFDVLHFHIDYLHFPCARRTPVPTLTTQHGRLDVPDLHPLFEAFPDMNLVSISDSQRAPIPKAKWMGTVYHGLPPDLYELGEGSGNYLAFLGRFAPEKRPDVAIEIAKRTGRKLKIAAKVDPADREYFKKEIQPLLQHPLIEVLGEIGEEDKRVFLGDALALLFPIDWPEPFGLVMIEAMACGTPVIAYPNGSVPEIIEDQKTGFLVSDVEEAVAAVNRLDTLNRFEIRKVFENRFSAGRMALDYLRLFQKISSKELSPRSGQ